MKSAVVRVPSEVCAPTKGLKPSAQGFNPGYSPGFQPWEPSKSTVRPEGARDAGTRLRSHLFTAQKSECATRTCDNWSIEPHFRLVRRFDLAPLQGASLLVNDSQG